MKKYLILLLIPILFGCKDVKETPEYMKLLAEKDSVQGITNISGQKINEYLADFNSIADNINQIKEKEKLITVSTNNTSELNTSKRDQINSDIQLIYDLMTKNKQMIANLSKKLKNSNLKIIELEKMITNLNMQLADKDKDINDLKLQLEKLHFDVARLNSNIDSLSTTNKEKESTINQKTSELNTAYYVFGTKKELIKNNIISKEGGIIGIGKTTKLSQDFNKDYFKKIDITKITKILISAKKAKIVTTHPSSSYHFDGENKVDNLVITNIQDFWSASKYLVIIVE
jgi:hypothetical protein